VPEPEFFNSLARGGPNPKLLMASVSAPKQSVGSAANLTLEALGTIFNFANLVSSPPLGTPYADLSSEI